jgi:hypothetical protein
MFRALRRLLYDGTPYHAAQSLDLAWVNAMLTGSASVF